MLTEMINFLFAAEIYKDFVYVTLQWIGA